MKMRRSVLIIEFVINHEWLRSLCSYIPGPKLKTTSNADGCAGAHNPLPHPLHTQLHKRNRPIKNARFHMHAFSSIISHYEVWMDPWTDGHSLLVACSRLLTNGLEL